VSETVSLTRPAALFGAAMIFFSTSVSADSLSLVVGQPRLVENSILTDTTSSRAPSLPGESMAQEQIRAKRIRELRGKYRDLLTPSQDFAEQKREEVEREL